MEQTKVASRTREASVLTDAINEKERRVRISFMSEEPCYNWGVAEHLLASEEACDLTRFKGGVAPILFNHNRDSVIGKMENVRFENGKGYLDIVFDDDEESEKIFQKVIGGSIRGTSVGYIRKQVVSVAEGETYEGKFEGECEVVTRWELLEVSIVSIPADSSTGVGRTIAQEETQELPKEEPKEEAKKEEEVKEETELLEEKGEQEMEEIKNENTTVEAVQKALESENARVKGITALCRTHNIEAEIMDSMLADTKVSVEKAREQVLDILAKKESPMKVTVTKDEGDKFRELATAGLCSRFGIERAEDSREVSRYANLSLRDLASATLENAGERNVRFLSADELHQRAMGSATFVGIVDDYAHKAMMKAYTEHAGIFTNFVSKGSNKDFKPNYQYQLSLDGEPVRMSEESGEFTYMDMKDARVATTVQTYGKGIRLTREIFINDELGIVNKAIVAQSQGFRRLQEKMFFDTFTKNSNFSTAKGNLVQTHKDISIEAWDEMEQLMLNQKDIADKGFIGVPPKYILAPTTQKMACKQLLTSTADPNANHSGVANTVYGEYQLFTSPYLTQKSASAYYFVADPYAIPGIEFTTLNGVDKPTSRTIVPAEHLGLTIQLYMDFGFNVLGTQGFVKNANA